MREAEQNAKLTLLLEGPLGLVLPLDPLGHRIHLVLHLMTEQPSANDQKSYLEKIS